MEELQELIKFLKDKGFTNTKIDVDLLCGIIEYFGSKQETKQLIIADVVKSFTAEEVVNELKESETLDDAISFFNSQK
jgi:mannitol/fructose-specific phosphotransferase system IIA component (Ntr-type)